MADVVDRLPTPAPKVAGLLEQAEEELLAFYDFPRAHWTKLRSTNPLERVNKEIGRRSDVLGIYPNDRALIRLAGMLRIEQNDEWLVQRRYLSDHSIRQVLSPPGESEQAGSNNNTKEEGRHPKPRLRTQRPNDDQELHHKTRLDSAVPV